MDEPGVVITQVIVIGFILWLCIRIIMLTLNGGQDG